MSGLGPMRIEVIDGLAGADALAPEWRALLARAATRSPVQAPLWTLSWWRVFGERGGRRLRIVTLRDSRGALCGLAPLLYRVAIVRGLPVRRLELLGTGEDEADEVCSDYGGVSAGRGHEDAVAMAFAAALRKGDLGAWAELVLDAMNGDDPPIAALERALGVAATESGACAYVALPRTWEAYLRSLESRSRYLVTRTLRDLDAWAGPEGVSLVRAGTPRDLDEGRRILRALHAERWSGEGGGVFASARFTRFHDLVMPKLLADPRDGGLDLTWLTARGRPIAVTYCVTFEDRILFYQGGRALDVPKGVRPGIALHALAIRRAIEEGRREYDFLGGVAQYKAQLATQSRSLVTLRAVAHSARSRIVDKARAKIDRAAALFRAARAVRHESEVAR